MKIRVNQLVDSTAYCSTHFGDICVKWIGDDPELGETYDAEVEISDVLVWGKNVMPSNCDKCTITYSNSQVSICGLLESIDNDGYSILRMGEHIIPFVVDDNTLETGKMIKINAKSVSVYPVYY